MPRRRDALPTRSDDLFLTDGGLETTLVFHEGIDLPHFASFVLLDVPGGSEVLRGYYRRYAELGRREGLGMVADSPTWRANRDWGRALDYDADALADVNRRAIDLMVGVRDELPAGGPAFLVAGSVGPRGDGYRPDATMSADEAADYHAPQIETFAASEADIASVLTLNYVEEAIGVARAAAAAKLPAVLSFTVETDGRLPTGQSLGEAIQAVDEATNASPLYYMVNCAHPNHFRDALLCGGAWNERIRGLRANASTLSHAELDEAEELDEGHPEELGEQLATIRERLTHINVLGGCCGTDERHIAAIARACLAAR